MAQLQIPFSGEPSFKESVTLEGITYVLRFDWNDQDGYWRMSIMDAQENPLVMGIKMVIFYPLTSQYKAYSIPPGMFCVIDANPATRYIDPGFSDFTRGRNLQLTYFESVA